MSTIDPFISYAQNFEDVMLWRALKNQANGFYVDVGAWSPDNDSVTRAFYERGWSGINVEPNPQFTPIYRERRPRDITLPIALSDRPGQGQIFLLAESGLSTMDAELAAASNPGAPPIPTVLQVSTLAEVLGQHAAARDIHFLKIDVEGLERRVLMGNDWARFRPWIVVIESTLPNTAIENHDSWESILVEADYSLAYADGLNRFYVRRENLALAEAFRYPPNFFDHFKLVGQFNAENRAQALHEQNEALSSLAQQTQAQLIEFEKQRTEQINTLTALFHQADFDRTERAKQVERLSELLRESEADRANRGRQIEILTALIRR